MFYNIFGNLLLEKMPDVAFFNLGIEFHTLKREAFSVFGLDVYWYSIFIMIGIVGGMLLAFHQAKITGQNPDEYADFLLYAIIISVIGARLYYVAFEWDSYKDNLLRIFAFREGGLAIYGAIIAGILSLIGYSKIKSKNFFLMADTLVASLPFGQMVGRLGNFVNKEAFGGYTDSLFAMSIRSDVAAYIPESVAEHIRTINGVDYISVQPTFLYEGLWSMATVIILLVYRKHKKFDGEVFFLYMLIYGVGRAIIEGLRTDQLIIGSTGIPVSQLLGAVFAVISFVLIIVFRKRAKRVVF